MHDTNINAKDISSSLYYMLSGGLSIALDYPWGLYLVEKGLITHNSLLTNLCMSYIMTHFCLMRNPYRILGHSQPVYEKVQFLNISLRIPISP